MNLDNVVGCVSESTNFITVTRLSGADCDTLTVDDFTIDFNFSVYPNPTSDFITVKYNGNRNLSLDVQVIDMLGKNVFSTSLSTENNMSLDLSRLNSGTYFINMIDVDSGNNIVKRIIKN